MFRFRYFLPVIFALGLLMVNPPGASAQGHRGGGGGGKGGGGGSGAHHSGGSAGNHHGGSYNHGHYYPGAYGLFADPFWYGYSPRFYDYGYVSPRFYNSYYNGDYVSPAATVVLAEPLNQTAQIDVLLPRADAKVWVDGNAMSATGTERAFYSPFLEPGYKYSYRVTAAWVENGQEVRVERTVPVAPNRKSLVDFTPLNTAPRMPPPKD